VLSSKHTRGALETPSGLIPNLVTEFFIASPPTVSRSLCIGSFFDLCTVTADTSKLPKPKLKNPRGSHYEVSFEVALSFGLTELKAQLVWEEYGIEKRWVRSPYSITFAEDEQGAGQNSIRPARWGHEDMSLNLPNSVLHEKVE